MGGRIKGQQSYQRFRLRAFPSAPLLSSPPVSVPLFLEDRTVWPAGIHSSSYAPPVGVDTFELDWMVEPSADRFGFNVVRAGFTGTTYELYTIYPSPPNVDPSIMYSMIL